MKKWLGILLLTVLWQLSATLADNNIFPGFLQVMVSLAENIKSILIHGFFSSLRLAAGVFLAVLAGMPAGILIGYHRKLSEFISPVIYLLAPIPKIALLPLIMLLFGIGDGSKIFIIF